MFRNIGCFLLKYIQPIMEEINNKFGLNSRVKLEEISKNHIGILKLIKSRIIQKDAEKIIEHANTIRKKDSGIKVSLICNNNICSKSLALLNKNNIEIILINILK